MVREFEYYLFENFDADQEVGNPHNPRSFLGREVDAILSAVAQHSANARSYRACCETYGARLVRRLLDGGILRPGGAGLAFDCPIFLREDAEVLHEAIASKAVGLTDLLEGSMEQLRACCMKIKNGFSTERNLYHILCGMVFDGYFFDYLSGKGALAVSRRHPSGLDYLTVIYEKCDDLQNLSSRLLCSYNRFVNAKCSLQSFGDAQGDRFDFYRFFRLMEQGRLPARFRNAEKMLLEAKGASKDTILDGMISLVRTGRCDPHILGLLELFGYVQNGHVSVPVYLLEHQKYFLEMENLVEECIGEEMSRVLTELAGTIDITAVKHGVNVLEIANELYHLVFGSINEELVSRGMVAAPQERPGEGRYFRCVEIIE